MPTNQEVRELAKELSAKWDGALVDLMEMAMQKVLVFGAEKQEAAQPATSLFQRDTAEVSCGDAAGGTATGNNYCRTLRFEGTGKMTRRKICRDLVAELAAAGFKMPKL